MLVGTTPSDPSDVGAAEPTLLTALTVGGAAAINVALLSARVLVPVVALPGVGEAEMAVPSLVAADGSRALPVFSSYDALRAWRPEARPVPMAGARVVAGAAAEGYDGIVVDVAGSAPVTIADEDLRRLAQIATTGRRQ